MTEFSNIMAPRADLGVKKVDNDLLILDKPNEKIHQLNSTASEIWEGLSDGLTEATIAEKFAKKFDIKLAQAEQDVRKIINQFIDLDLLRTPGSE